jgi:precorrin-6Y C5,15-methyltransferase (decarboxylating)
MSNLNPNLAHQAQIRWLSIVGIGEDGIPGLDERARSLVESAEIVFGGARHLSLAAELIHGTARPWGSPFEESIAAVLACRGRPVCVLASGDPFQHGIGGVLARHVAPEEAIAVPALSAFSLAASRLLWSIPRITLLSLCGRSLDFIRPHLQPGARILALTSGASAPAALAGLLSSAGFGESRVTVLEALGGPRERIRSARASAFDLEHVAALNTLAIEVVAGPAARILPRAAGLADDLFEHDGQITKREIRALTLSALAPSRAQHLWDIGAGSGSVAIEWMLADPSLSAMAIERRSDRAARIRLNAASFGVPDLQVLEADAPQALNGLQPPDAIFVGGGVTAPGLIETARAALRPNGRLVINAVTLEAEALLLRTHAHHGGTLIRMEIHRAGPIGDSEARLTSWRPAMPITQWTWVKP